MIVRTGFAFKSATGHLSEVISRLKEIGATTCAVADLMSTYSYVKLTKLAKEEGLRVVYGVELMVSHTLGAKRQGMDRWIFLAKDDLLAIHELIALATENTGKEPCLTYKQAVEAEGVFKIMGEAAQVDLVEPQEDLFLGLSPASPKGQVKSAFTRGIKLLAYSNNKYPRKEDLEFYRVTLGRNASSQTYPMHIMSDEEWIEALPWLYEDAKTGALENRDRTLRMCNAVLPKASLLSPDKPKDLRQLCLEGAEKLECDLSRPEYADRLDRELSMIREKEYDDYFHIVADIMAFARDNMVVGPARGSSCGSLVCYLLGITAIDPIPFGLVFERFIDVTRKDLPDIDLDFSEANRHLVFEYVSKKYGRDRSARLGSVNMFKAKAALNTVGTNLKIPKAMMTELANTVIKRNTGDARAGSTIEDAINDTDIGQKLMRLYPEVSIVTRLEGHPAAAAQHAAGIVLTDKPVKNYVAVNYRTGATMCDKRDAEDLNLLKIDALGLTQLTIFERCLELIGEKPRNDFLEAIPLDDQAAFDVMNHKKFSGIFQFIPGAATIDLVNTIHSLGGKLDNIEDLVSLTAIVRPGPLKSGQAVEWMHRRMGVHPVNYVHPSLEPYLKSTYGLVLFQEQVLNIGREIGDLTWEDVTALRKAMSKILGKEYFSKFAEKWVEGAIKKVNMPRDIGIKFFDELCNFGSWAFNRSHSVAYGIVSYWCCWLKAHYPLEFMAATLDSQTDPFQQIETLRELRSEGIGYVPVDPIKSLDKWSLDKESKMLLGPLTNVIGIGPKKLIEIMDSRKNGTELKKALKGMLERAKTPIDSLDPIREAVLAHDPKKLNIVTHPTPVIEASRSGKHVMIMGVITRVVPGDLNELHKVAERGYKINGPSKIIRFWMRDDTGEVFCRLNQWKTEKLGTEFLEKTRANKTLYAVKGRAPSDFPMINVDAIKYIGELDDHGQVEALVRGPEQKAGSRGLQGSEQGAELVRV